MWGPSGSCAGTVGSCSLGRASVKKIDKGQDRYRKLARAALFAFVRGGAGTAGGAVITVLVWLVHTR